MSTEEGIVTKTRGDRAWVRVERTSMCESCQSRGACSSLGGGKDMECEAFNNAGSKEGDRVIVQIKSGSLLKIAFLFYMVPVIALMGGALAGMKWSHITAIDSDLFSLICGILAFTVSFFVINIIGHRLKNSREHMPEVIKIVKAGFIINSNDGD